MGDRWKFWQFCRVVLWRSHLLPNKFISVLYILLITVVSDTGYFLLHACATLKLCHHIYKFMLLWLHLLLSAQYCPNHYCSISWVPPLFICICFLSSDTSVSLSVCINLFSLIGAVYFVYATSNTVLFWYSLSPMVIWTLY